MSEWWTYRLSSFLLFSPRTYFRLQELYNLDVWPAQLAGLVLGIALLVVLLRRHRFAWRIAAIGLAVCWAFVAWAWHAIHYATINWAATYFGTGFAMQALLLLWSGAFRSTLAFDPPSPIARTVGIALAVWGVAGSPILSVLLGRSLAQADYFGTGPDATVIATLGVLLLARGAQRWLLWPIPLLWCALAGAFAAMMRLPDALVAPLAGLLAVVTAAVGARLRRRVVRA